MCESGKLGSGRLRQGPETESCLRVRHRSSSWTLSSRRSPRFMTWSNAAGIRPVAFMAYSRAKQKCEILATKIPRCECHQLFVRYLYRFESDVSQFQDLDALREMLGG